MRELWQLSKVGFLQMLNALQVSRGKKKRFGAAGALALIAFLALYLSGLYSNMLGSMLVQAGVGEFFVPVMALLVTPIGLVFTLPSAGSALFGGKDTDFLLSLPVGTFHVAFSKMAALYVENLLFSGLWMVPVGIAAYYYGIVPDAGCFLRLLVVIVALPFWGTLLSGIGGLLMAFLGSRARHKALMQNLAGIVLFAVLFVGSMQINRLSEVLLAGRQEAERLFATWLFVFGWMGRGLAGDVGALVLALLVSVLPFVGFVWLFSMGYRKILSGLQSRILRSDYRLGQMKAQGQGLAILKKELVRLFNTPAYLMNCCISAVLLVGFAVWVAVDQKNMSVFVEVMGKEWMAPLFLVCMELMVSMLYPSAVSISLEGNAIWILKEAPVDTKTLFAAKAALNLIVAVPVVFLTTLLFIISGFVTVPEGGCMFLVCLALGTFLAEAGLVVNLHFPSLEAGDMRVVKNSASALISVFGGLLFAGVLSALLLFTRNVVPFLGFCLAQTAVLALLAAGAWKYLGQRGAQLFREL